MRFYCNWKFKCCQMYVPTIRDIGRFPVRHIQWVGRLKSGKKNAIQARSEAALFSSKVNGFFQNFEFHKMLILSLFICNRATTNMYKHFLLHYIFPILAHSNVCVIHIQKHWLKIPRLFHFKKEIKWFLKEWKKHTHILLSTKRK